MVKYLIATIRSLYFSNTGFLFLLLFACESRKSPGSVGSVADNRIPYVVKLAYQHNEEAFTQGLVFDGDKVYESTGTHKPYNSWIAEVYLESGKQEKKVELDPVYFGEGITVLNNKIYQLSWKNKLGFIYELPGFKHIGSFTYATEGWGITHDGQDLIVSDGTDKIYYLDTLQFRVVKTVTVTERGNPLHKLNELEYIDGYIYANQWETNFIVKIDPETGEVEGKLDLSPLANEIKRNHPDADVLNGIAYNSQSGDILVTGKLWPKAYIIQLEK